MAVVQLVSYTQPVDQNVLQNYLAYVARVSNPNNQNNNKTADKLLKYCLNHKHWSVFEMADATMEITTTRDISRQIIRHRSFSFQEFSQRYSNVNTKLPRPRQARLQDNKNRQNSIEIDYYNDKQFILATKWSTKQLDIYDACYEAYNWALENGIAKEQARVVLPEGLTETTLYMKGSIRSWIHYIQLRTDCSTQKEHREVAQLCKEQLATIFPLINEL